MLALYVELKHHKSIRNMPFIIDCQCAVFSHEGGLVYHGVSEVSDALFLPMGEEDDDYTVNLHVIVRDSNRAETVVSLQARVRR